MQHFVNTQALAKSLEVMFLVNIYITPKQIGSKTFNETMDGFETFLSSVSFFVFLPLISFRARLTNNTYMAWV